MKKLKKYLAIGCTVMMVVTATGCSSTTTSSDATETTTQDTTTKDSTTTTEATDTTKETTDEAQTTDESVVYGKVTAVDGTSVTLALGDMPQGEGMQNGEAPAAPDANAASSTDTATKEAPSGEAPSGEASSGEAPSGGAPTGEAPDITSMFVESGETLTITVEDESLIKIMSGAETTTGSLSDITVDTILAIEYDDSNNITLITVQSAAK